jgi:hypothetical protein
MKFGKKKPISRTEPTKAKPSVAPAGTPTAVSAPEVPSPQATEVAPVKMEPAVGESLKTVTATQLTGKVETEKPVTRSGGASWFVPPQKPSGFGMGGTK